MARTILVLGNCHIGGVSAALGRIFPADTVSATPFNPQKRNIIETGALKLKLAQADVVVGNDHVEKFLHQQSTTAKSFVKMPRFLFNGFHPDVVYARKTSTGEMTKVNYNSAITVWAYRNRLDPVDVVPLFSKRTFKALGYFDAWNVSAKSMKAAFDACGMDFARLFRTIKREGVFMYTINHPKISVLTLVAKLVALKLGAAESVWDKEVNVADALVRAAQWPVYPEIAHELALPGSYSWWIDETGVEGLEAYVEFAYNKYVAAGIKPNDIEMVGVDFSHYDAVLAPQMRGA